MPGLGHGIRLRPSRPLPRPPPPPPPRWPAAAGRQPFGRLFAGQLSSIERWLPKHHSQL